MNRILIVGASVSGLTTAFWLAQYGFQVSIVELNSELRKGGYTVELHNSILEIVAKMGILQQVKNSAIEVHGLNILNSCGQEIFRKEYSDDLKNHSDTITLLRGDLIEILGQNTLNLPNVNIIFRDTVEDMTSCGSNVFVRFRSGVTNNYLAVIGADGIYSQIRQLMFNDLYPIYLVKEERYCCWSTENFLNLSNWVTLYRTTDDIQFGLRTIKQNQELNVVARFSILNLQDSIIQQDWKEYTKELLLDHPFEINIKLAETLSYCDTFYSDTPNQIRLPKWYQGNVVLVGDAGYCSSPILGKGATMALLGAYILAGELAIYAKDPMKGFKSYEKISRSSIEAIQNQVLSKTNYLNF